MTGRLAIGICAWVLTLAMGASIAWVLIEGSFMAANLASLPAGERASAEADFSVVYVAMAGIIAVTMAYATVGLLLASRPSSARIGAILMAGGILFAAIPFGYLAGGLLVTRDPFGTVANLVFLFGPASVPLGYTLILPVLAITFPDGRLPSPRWRWPVSLIVACLIAATTNTLLAPGAIAGAVSLNPLGVEAIPTWLRDLAGILGSVGIVAMSALAIAAVITRYRRGSTLARLQLRWFLAAFFVAVIPLAGSAIPGIGGPGSFVVAAFGLLLIPLSVWIAVTHYHLYELDRLISRTIGWGVVTGVLLAVFAAGVLALQAVLADVTQGQTLAVAASTLLAFALFQPVRRRVQWAVDRRFDRAHYDGVQTAAAFAERLRHEVDLSAISLDARTTIHAAMRPVAVGLWLRHPVTVTTEPRKP